MQREEFNFRTCAKFLLTTLQVHVKRSQSSIKCLSGMSSLCALDKPYIRGHCGPACQILS